jgi:uncharacterized protein YbaR (Trm112 family)
MSIDDELLEILACPETKQPLAEASSDVLAKLNAQIEQGSLRTRGGEPVSETINEALVREDGKILYIVDDGIPVMLIEESIELS